MKVAPICPCCGTDIALDSPIIINDFAMNGAGYPLFYKGTKLPLSPGEELICWSLMKNYPAHVTTAALGERIGSDCEDVDNAIKVLVCRIRRKMRQLDAPQSIETVTGHRAYRWDPRGFRQEEGATVDQ